MGELERVHRGSLTVLALPLVLVLGCAARAPRAEKQSVAAASLPPQTLSQLEPEPTPPAVPPVAAPAPDPTVVVVDPGGEESAADNLVVAARAERERRRGAGPPVAVLNDKNIQQFAKDRKLTFASPEANPSTPKPTTQPDGVTKDPETYWRERGREIRERWRRLGDELAQARDRAATLRTRFYSTDDPYIRDTDIKPAWDRTLDRISTLEAEIREIRGDLDHFQEEGQRAGALPAWLLDGVELEPEAERTPDKTADPAEPVIYQEKPH